MMGEMDIVKNAFDGNYRVNIPTLLNISRTVFENVTAYAEIYANWSTNPQAPNIYTAGLRARLGSPRPNFQLDVGINIGLQRGRAPTRSTWASRSASEVAHRNLIGIPACGIAPREDSQLTLLGLPRNIPPVSTGALSESCPAP